MDDNRIEIVARLDTSRAAVVKIEADLSQVADQVNKDRAFKIIGNLDLPKTTQRIQSQLATINKDLNLNIGKINVDSNVENVVSEIQNNLSNVKTGVKANIQIDSTPIEEFGEALGNLDIKGEAIDKLKNELESLEIIVTKIIPKFQQLKGEDTQKLTSLAIQGVDKFGNNVNLTGAVKDGDIEKLTTTVTQNLAKIEQANKKVEDSTKAVQTAYNDFLKLQGTADVYSKKYGDNEELQTQFENIRKLMEEFDNTQPVEKQRETIIKLDNALKSIKIDIDAINQAKKATVSSTPNDYYPNIAKIVSSDKSSKSEQLDVAKTTLNDFFSSEEINDSANRVKRAVEDVSGELQRFYIQVEKEDKSVETLTYALNEQGDAYEYLGKTIREADNSTDFRRKDITTQWNIQSENLKKFIANAEKAGLASTDLKDDIENLQSKLAAKGDTSAMNSFLDDLDIAKAKYQALNAEARKDSFAVTTSNKIQKLSADMEAFAKANERAVSSTKMMSTGITFADKWNQLTTEMAKGAALSTDEIKHLREELGIFGKEAEAAGLKGRNAWGKFLDSFKVMSSYLSANMVFNMVKRQLRGMAEEVIAVDTAMTELRKVTEATNADFEKFAKSAAQTGRELGASISDVINATATFARLGESLPDAEELGRVATLFKNVGDGITEEEAAEDLVSTMKAFNIEAKDSISIVDKFNEVGNNFAISSGGIGEALKRSASALASANNDISESIALITTANTIAQDPTTVGQGIKTMSLRIRSTKTELEEMGEDAEGAAENVSKLREQMLALTGVDIQLDANTYKSTYQILLEISKVWGQLDDMAQASVLEQLFGKRQANIGAAILENGELLEKVYKSASNSAGSAMREQEEYAKSIQYSIDSLKAAYQGLAQDIMSNDFLKGLVDTGADLIDILDKIIDKFGLIPPLVASIGAVGSINGVGFFKTIESDATKSGKALALLGKSFSDIRKDYAAITDDTIGFKKIGNALSGIFGFSSSDIDAIAKYNKLIESGVGKTEAMKKAMSGASLGAQQLVQNSKTATVAITGLSVSEKVATVATEALGIALNTALTFGIGLLIQGIITGIMKLVNAEKEAAEKAKELQDQAVETARNYTSEKQSLEDLVEEYVALATTTSDLTTEKQRLLSIQDKINESISTQTDKVDLLNESLAENLRLTAEQEYHDAKKTVSELETQAGKEDFSMYKGYAKDALKVQEALEEEFINYLNAEHSDIAELYPNLAPQGDTLAEMVENYQEIINLYGEWEGHNDDALDLMNAVQRKAEEQLKIQNETNEAYETAAKVVKDYEEAYGSELGGRIGEILESARDLSIILNESDNVTERYNATQQIKDLEIEARGLIGTNTILREQVDSVFGAIDAGITKTISSSGDLWSAFYDNLDDVRKKQLDNIDKIEKAMQSLANGDNISHDDFWGISQLDTDNIIQGIEVINGEFKVSGAQLQTIKDNYIAGIIEGLKEENALTEENIKNTREELELAKIALQVQIASGVNSAGDAALVKAKQDAVTALEKSLADYDQQLTRNTTLIREFDTHIGNTVSALEAAQAVQAKADNLLKAYEYRIDQIVDGFEEEKEAIEASRDALQDQLDVLEEQQKAIQETIDRYDTAADVVADAIQKQIDALKEQNEEREEALDLAEKLANLENAKNNKVRTYTEAGGWTYEAKKADVQKAQKELDKAQTDEQIKTLEAYLKKWQNRSNKAQQAADERTATEILGADWREKIAKQDEDIFKMYEEEYDKYNEELYQVSNVEMETLKKAIDAKNKDIAAKEAQIKEWQKYKSEVQKAASEAKAATEDWWQLVHEVALNESDDYDVRTAKLNTWYEEYSAALQNLTYYQNQLNEATNDFDSSDMQEQIDELVKTVEKLKWEDDESEGHKAWLPIELVGSHSNGGVNSNTGLAMLHGTKQKAETIFNANDSAKLYDLVHNTPNLVASMLTDGTRIAQNLSSKSGAANAVTFNGTTINLPNVQNPEQFARQMEMYMQTVLSESQVYKPRR